ncbi:MAG: hypothetical protein LBM93_12110, partial [Oscillospiraceae bacterium]|nr:hypothetical protein [Oscillospiraceae bacterium]
MVIYTVEILACFIECVITIFFLHKYFNEVVKYSLVKSIGFLFILLSADILLSVISEYEMLAILYSLISFIYTLSFSLKNIKTKII